MRRKQNTERIGEFDTEHDAEDAKTDLTLGCLWRSLESLQECLEAKGQKSHIFIYEEKLRVALRNVTNEAVLKKMHEFEEYKEQK